MLRHQRDVAAYITAEVREGAILGPLRHTALHPMVPGKCPLDLAEEGQPAQEGHHGPLMVTASVVTVNGYTPNIHT